MDRGRWPLKIYDQMAEFCSICTPFKKADYNLPKIALELERGHSYSFVCEGCQNRALYKDEEGRLWLAVIKRNDDRLKWHAVNLDELS